MKYDINSNGFFIHQTKREKNNVVEKIGMERERGENVFWELKKEKRKKRWAYGGPIDLF